MTRESLNAIHTFRQLIAYLRDELDWPIESDDFEELTFDYAPEELGLDASTAVKIKEIKQLRPLTTKQPWGIFFVSFEPKRLPVVVLRRILSSLVVKKRKSANKSQQAAWQLHDLLFISSYGEADHRDITFAHFAEEPETGDLPVLRLLGWDDEDTKLHVDFVERELKSKLRWPSDEQDVGSWRTKWASAFRLRPREVIKTSQQLALRLADLARKIRRRTNSVLGIESDKGPMRKLHVAFKEALIHDLSQDDFADMYAQTISYGLLTARVSRPSGLVADNLTDMVPVTNPFLKELLEMFLTVGGRKGKIDFDELGVNEVVDMLRDADMEAVLRDFGDRNPQEDPVIHFYELFLKEYDPDKRMKRGVFYTPRPVVSFIVRSVDEILRREFKLEDGLADTTTWGEMAKRHKALQIPAGASPDQAFVQILDPAVGTGTFLVEAIDLIHRTMESKWRKQGYMALEFQRLWNEYVPKHLLPRLYGFELMMAPYAIAHMKIGLKLFETGYRFGSTERARVYLTNSLEPASDHTGQQRGFEEWAPALAHEAQAVNKVKSSQRFTVVIGNPPYAGHSPNTGEWIQRLVDSYFYVNGEPLGEANSKWLRDDYVKFMRLGQYVIEKAGCGVFGLITNHGYIDNPTFRGMRTEFMKHFSQLWVTDLHGNFKKNDKTDDGSNDDNVFDIQQGVGILVATSGVTATSVIRHCDVRGTRAAKYVLLANTTAQELARDAVTPSPPFFLYVPQAQDVRDEYDRFAALNPASVESSLGVLTKRDSLVVAFTPDELVENLRTFVSTSISDKEAADVFGLPMADKDTWDLKTARRAVGTVKRDLIRPILYRPFDWRYIYYDEVLVARMNRRVLRHLDTVKDNRGLILGRQGMATGAAEWDVCFVCNGLVDQNIYRRGGGTVFPLRLAISNSELQLDSARINLPRDVTSCFVRFRATPEEVLDYAYALFHSGGYRARYAEILRIDFPRLPLTDNLQLFRALAVLGGELVALHLLESPRVERFIAEYIGGPVPEVEKVSWSKTTVWLDKRQTTGFKGVCEEVWNFHVGGYQVCEKWLKDRKARTLSKGDVRHYQKIVVALSETIRLMKEIDEVIEAHGGWPAAFAERVPEGPDAGIGLAEQKVQ